MSHPQAMQSLSQDIHMGIPLMVLLGTGIVLMLLDGFRKRGLLPWVGAAGLGISALLAIPGPAGQALIHTFDRASYYHGMIDFGGTASVIHILLSVAGLAAIFFVADFLKRNHHEAIGEVYALIVFAVIGMIMLATANDLVLVFIGLEVMSVCLYIMAGAFKTDLRSNEAALKYFLLGAFASAFLLFGIALIYGISGVTQFSQLKLNIHQLAESPMFLPALGLILVGFLFKIAAFPFHSWTPDVYTGAPTPLAGFMATGSKMAAFISLSFFLGNLVQTAEPRITTLLLVMAVASMIYGNIVAAQQRNVKRLLAYSSIAHTGYLMLGLCAGPKGYLSVVFYMLIYTLMTTGAFGVLSSVEGDPEDADLDRLKGLGTRRPLHGILLSIFLLSLSGMPPLAGFMGKYFVFAEAVSAKLITAAVIGVLTSVVGAYYYLKVIVYMYFRQPEEGEIVAADAGYQGSAVPLVAGVLLAIALLVLGLMPYELYDYLNAFYQYEGRLAAF